MIVYYYYYLPLGILCEEFALWARLRSSNVSAAAWALEEVEQMVAQTGARWLHAQVVPHADGGCRSVALGAILVGRDAEPSYS